MRFTFDSNVLVYAHDRSESVRHPRSLELVERATAADCVLLLQCLAEYFKIAITKLKKSPGEARAAQAKWRRAFPVYFSNPQTFDDAIDAVEAHRMAFWDAMIWAAARAAGCGAILTEDLQDGQSIGGVRFINPFLPENKALIDRLFA
ncbi:MAG: PIN domain-containing protein [Alphaproteobacteria bacterium]|nr:PIN domain-containing protein [Alphaproteobacteria bacterium]